MFETYNVQGLMPSCVVSCLSAQQLGSSHLSHIRNSPYCKLENSSCGWTGGADQLETSTSGFCMVSDKVQPSCSCTRCHIEILFVSPLHAEANDAKVRP